MANDYVRVSRRQARRILDLYTLQGYTQQQIGALVFAPSVEKKIDRGVLVRRVLHQLGLNMQSRSNYADTGLTPRMIDSILGNPRLIFPLAVPLQGELRAFISFEKELSDHLNGTGRASKTRSRVLNVLALALIAGLHWIAMNFGGEVFIMFLPIIGVFAVSVVLRLADEEYHAKEKGKAIFGFIFTAVIFYIIFLLYRAHG